jgi:hypothetical protein
LILVVLGLMGLFAHIASNPDTRARVSSAAFKPNWRGPSPQDLDTARRVRQLMRDMKERYPEQYV